MEENENEGTRQKQLVLFKKEKEYFSMKTSKFPGAAFQGVRATQEITGLGRNALYAGAASGHFPCIRQGNRILFNVPALLELLDRASKQGGSFSE
jgi:hypothetical protein